MSEQLLQQILVELTLIKGQINGMQDQLNGMQDQMNGLQDEMDGMQGQMNGMQDQMAEVKHNIVEMKKDTDLRQIRKIQEAQDRAITLLARRSIDQESCLSHLACASGE